MIDRLELFYQNVCEVMELPYDRVSDKYCKFRMDSFKIEVTTSGRGYSVKVVTNYFNKNPRKPSKIFRFRIDSVLEAAPLFRIIKSSMSLLQSK